MTYYLVKQGRIDEAVSAFKGATAIAQKTGQRGGNSASHLYYDYLRAYLALSQGDVKGAQEIAQVHEAVSHPAWRDRFKSIYAPEALIEDPAEDKGSEAASGSLTESLDFKMEGAALVISAYQVDEVEVRLYPINLEILFSNNPLSLEGQRVSVSPLIKPSFTQVVKLSETGESALSSLRLGDSARFRLR